MRAAEIADNQAYGDPTVEVAHTAFASVPLTFIEDDHFHGLVNAAISMVVMAILAERLAGKEAA